MYKLSSKIRYSEIDYSGKLALGKLVDYFQDSSTFQTEESNLGPLYFQNAGKAWIINAWQIEILRYPELGEKVNVGTWPYNFKRFMGERNYIMESDSGELLARANSVWALYDMKKGFPSSLTEEEIQRYGVEPPLEMEYKPRKIKCGDNWTYKDSFVIGMDRIDTNGHMNNAEYVTLACNYLPEGRKVGEVRVEYKQSIMLGQKVDVSIINEETVFYIRFANEAGEIYAIHEFSFKEDIC